MKSSFGSVLRLTMEVWIYLSFEHEGLRVSVSSTPSLCWQTLHRIPSISAQSIFAGRQRCPAAVVRLGRRVWLCPPPSPAFRSLPPPDGRHSTGCSLPSALLTALAVQRRHTTIGFQGIVGIAIADRYFRSLVFLRRTGAELRETALNSKAEPSGPPCKVSKSLRTRSGEHFSLLHPHALLLASQQPARSQAAPGVTCNSSISTASPVLMIGLIDTRNRTFARQKCIVLSEKAAWSLRAAPDANFCNVRPPPPCPNSKIPIRPG